MGKICCLHSGSLKFKVPWFSGAKAIMGEKKKKQSLAWWHIPISPVLERLR
jgi:hypothetical protein